MYDGAALGQEVSEIVRDYLARALAPALARLAAIEQKYLDLPSILERVETLEQRSLLPGPQGERGEAGAPGRDGIGIVGTVLDRSGALVLTMSDGEVRAVGPVAGRDGADGAAGRDGLDGLSLEDMMVEYDGERSLTVGFVRGEVRRTWTLQLPVPIYRGVYQAERAYTRGDIVTFGGSSWQCNRDTTEKPGEIANDWTLSVKRGRDGRAAK